MSTKWTYEACKKAALFCHTRAEFWEKYSRAARIAKLNGWDNDFFSKNETMPPNYWTKERCIEESKKYKFMTEFRDNSNTAFYKCKNNGWLNKITWLKDNIMKFDTTSNIHLVYCYQVLINNEKFVYVGRTIQLKQRDYAHRKKTKKRDAIRDFCNKNGIEIPSPIILETNLTLSESQEREDYYIKYYSKIGYHILNIGKTGLGIGSIGGAGIKWDHDTCYQEAMKYKTKIDFYKNSNSAWCKARKFGWLKEYTWLYSPQKPHKYWNYDTCMEVAKKCSCINDLRKNYEEAYKLARKFGWIQEYTWFKVLRKRLTENEVINILKECKTKKEVKEKFTNVYRYIKNHKRFDLYKYMGE